MDDMFGSEEMQEILHDFLVETTELLESIDQQLIELEEDPENTEILNSIFRSVHTIKGASGFLGLTVVVDVAHKGEELLDKLRNHELVVTSLRMDALLAAADMLKLLIEHIRADDGLSEDTSEILARLREAEKTTAEDTASAGSPEEAAPPEEAPPVEEAPPIIEEPAAPVEEEPVVVEEPPAPEEADAPEEEIEEDLEEISDEDRLIAEAMAPSAPEPPSPAQAKPAAAAKPAPSKRPAREETETIRVDTERLDSVMNMVGELVLGRNRLLRLSSRLEDKYEGDEVVEALAENSAHINLITTDLQLAVMKTRMQPVAKVFGRFPRMVRDLARDKGKEVQLLLVGQETELDKTVIEEIGDPLVHMVRNAVDHGIEMPDVRAKAGKDKKGTVTLSAFHKGNNIHVCIEDDGKGLNAESLRLKAIEKNLITLDEADKMSDSEAFNLIFAPGFSTASVITDTSGRGVGMDVVKTNINKLNGSIDIESGIGKGSKMTLQLPLTLAIIHALMIGFDKEEYAVPLSSVVEILKISEDEITTIEGQEALYFRDKVYPLLRLSDVVETVDTYKADDEIFGRDAPGAVTAGAEAGTEDEAADYSQETEEFSPQNAPHDDLGEGEEDAPEEGGEDEKSYSYAVLMSHGDKTFGLLVERLIGQEEVVIKSMGNYLSNIKGISGATITGDGRVVLIVDVVGLVSKVSGIGV